MNKIIFIILIILVNITNLYANNVKLTLLYVQMQHCPWCHKMNKEVFDNPEMTKKLEQMYTIVKLKKGDPQIPTYLHPKFFPTTYILSKDKKKLIDELPGYMKATQFTEYLHDLYEIETKNP